MGMFDYLTCTVPLPDGYADMQGRWFQTKSLELEFMEHFEIAADGRLILHAKEREWRTDEDAFLGGRFHVVREWKEPQTFTGDVWFYDFRQDKDASSGLVEFRARFVDGCLVGPIVAAAEAVEPAREIAALSARLAPLEGTPPTALRDSLAAYAHEAWAGWMAYLFRFGATDKYGAFIINADKVERWRRQMQTPYAALSEAERESDRREADAILAILREHMQ
jgi:hypothetical protein